MTGPGYVLSDAAEADLREIIRHSRNEWGAAQVRPYIMRLAQGMDRLATGHGTCKDLSALYPALRMVHCERHYIFGLPRRRAPVLIVAILHERMDLMARLADRL